MLFAVWMPLVTQVLVVLGLLAWLGFGRPETRSGLIIRAALVAAYIVAIALGGLWLVIPWYTPMIYGVFFLLALRFPARNDRFRLKKSSI